MRRESIDNMKAFGMMTVIIAHCISFYSDFFGIPSTAASLTASLCYSANVAVFFVLAGYLCRPQDIPRYYLKKVKAVLVPFVIFSLLKIVYSVFITDRYVHDSTVPGMFRDAFLNGRLYWFVYTILILFLLAPLFWKKERIVLTLAVLLAAICLDTYLFVTGKTDAVLLFQINNVLVHIPFFLTGILLSYIPRERLTSLLKSLRPLLIPLCIAATVIMCFIYIKDDRVILPREIIYPLRFAAAFPIIYLMYAAADLITLKNGLLRSIGRFSLQIMLFDSFFKVVLYGLFGKVLPSGEYLIWIVSVLDLLLCLASAFICSKIPVIRFLVGIGGEKKDNDKKVTVKAS